MYILSVYESTYDRAPMTALRLAIIVCHSASWHSSLYMYNATEQLFSLKVLGKLKLVN